MAAKPRAPMSDTALEVSPEQPVTLPDSGNLRVYVEFFVALDEQGFPGEAVTEKHVEAHARIGRVDDDVIDLDIKAQYPIARAFSAAPAEPFLPVMLDNLLEGGAQARLLIVG